MQDIRITILPERYNVSLLKVDFPWSRQEIIAELEKEEWYPYGMETAVEHDAWTGKRYKVHRPRSPLLQSISRYFARDDVRDYVIECLYRDKPILQINWQMYPWRMSMNTELHAEFTKDLPGFENGLHCDMRRLVATGMIYLTEQDDERVSSCFYANPMREDPHRITTEFGNGWIHSNDWNTWHDGWNRSDQVRYSILLALTLHVKHQPMASDNPNKPGLDHSGKLGQG